MSTGTGIQWTQATWNPVVGCTRASAGCDHCYAVKQTYRLEKMGQTKYAGLTVLNGRGDRHFNGVVRTVEDALAIPLGWKKPRMIFVNSMSDLFHKDVPVEFIWKAFAVMASCPKHTFQILTKRADRMAEVIGTPAFDIGVLRAAHSIPGQEGISGGSSYPLPNIWVGTSVENQEQADERIPHLLRCPAAVRFLSVEPMLGPIDLSRGLSESQVDNPTGVGGSYLHWVIVGGESGLGARPCEIAWVRSVVRQCAAADVACFVKQLGGNVCTDGVRQHLIDRKGGDPQGWPDDLRVRQFPTATQD